MKLFLHIVWKDFLRMRGWLACWAVLLAAEIGVGWMMRAGDWLDAGEDWQRLVTAAKFLTGLNGAIVFPLTLLLVQEDALAGTRQFWITRPISGVRLLAAKCIGVVLILGGLPVLVALPWWLSCGFGLREIAWATVETVGLNGVIALPALLVASLADSVQRAFLWTLVLIAAAGSGTVMWGFFVAARNDSGAIYVAWARTWIPLAVLAAATVAATATQFLTRRFGRSLAIFGGGIATAVAIAGWWPAAWSAEYNLTEANAGRAAAVKLEFVKATMPPTATRNGQRDFYMSVDMIARDVPPDLWLEGIDGSIHSWRWPGGPVMVRDGWLSVSYRVNEWFPMRAALGLNAEKKDEETERTLLQAWQKKPGWPPEPPGWAPPVSTNRDVSAVAMVPRSLAARMRTEPPAYEAREWLQLIRPKLSFETPLRVGGWQSHDAHRMRVARIERFIEGSRDSRFADQFKVAVVETRPTTWRDDWQLVYFPHQRWQSWEFSSPDPAVYLVNRSLGQMNGIRTEDGQAIRVRSVEIFRRTLMFSMPKVSRGGKWVDWQPSWLDGATLALVGFQEEARFERTVKVERFEPNK